MPFTRSFIKSAAKESDVELPKELIDALINEHLSVRDAYAESRVKEALEENKPKDPEPVNVKESEEYKTLEQEYNDYKEQVASEKTLEKKRAAFRKMLGDAGIADKYIDAVMRISAEDIDGVEFDEKDELKDSDTLVKSTQEKYPEFVRKNNKRGAGSNNPPAGDPNDPKGKNLDPQPSHAAQLAAQYHNNLYGTPKEG